MPFNALDGVSKANVKLEQVESKRFKLLEGFRYRREHSADSFAVTSGDLGNTDLTSVPFGLRWFVNSYGRHTLAALLHDCLINGMCARAATIAPAVPPTRSQADDIFLEALSERKVPIIRRHLMWSAVTFNTRFSYAGGVAKLLMVLWILLALAGSALFFSGFFWGFPWVPIAAALAPFGASALWASKWKAGIWFGYGVVFLVPAAVVVHLSFLAYLLAEEVVGSLSKQGPEAGPPSPENF